MYINYGIYNAKIPRTKCTKYPEQILHWNTQGWQWVLMQIIKCIPLICKKFNLWWLYQLCGCLICTGVIQWVSIASQVILKKMGYTYHYLTAVQHINGKTMHNFCEVYCIPYENTISVPPTPWASSTGLTAVSKFKPRLPAQWVIGTHRKGPSRTEKVTSKMNWPIRNLIRIRNYI